MTAKTRRYIYGVATALLPLLVIHGIIDDGDMGLWIAVLGAGLVPQLAMQNTSTKKPAHRKNRQKEQDL